MFDAKLQPFVRRALDPAAAVLAGFGVRAEVVTIGGFAVGVVAALALALGWFQLGLALILVNRLADGLDGALARRSGPTERGAFLDIALDFVFYALVPLGFGLADPQRNALAAAALLAAFVGAQSSFLAFAAVAKGRRAPDFPLKGVYYLGGLAEGAETIAFFVAMALWPAAFAGLAYAFAALCVATTLTRLHQGWEAFGARHSPGDSGPGPQP